MIGIARFPEFSARAAAKVKARLSPWYERVIEGQMRRAQREIEMYCAKQAHLGRRDREVLCMDTRSASRNREKEMAGEAAALAHAPQERSMMLAKALTSSSRRP
jgi:hypothetical protein